jgi:hypothetical protein
MAFSNLTATLVGSGNVNVTYTLTTANLSDAQQWVQNMIKFGGFWAPMTNASGTFQVFYPATSVLYLTVS